MPVGVDAEHRVDAHATPVGVGELEGVGAQTTLGRQVGAESAAHDEVAAAGGQGVEHERLLEAFGAGVVALDQAGTPVVHHGAAAEVRLDPQGELLEGLDAAADLEQLEAQRVGMRGALAACRGELDAGLRVGRLPVGANGDRSPLEQVVWRSVVVEREAHRGAGRGLEITER